MARIKNQKQSNKPEEKPIQIGSETQTHLGSNLVRRLNKQEGRTMKRKFVIGLVVSVVILAGVATGYVLSLGEGIGVLSTKKLKRQVEADEIVKGTLVGVADKETFRDSAEGTLEKGGINGEGSHHLVRPGGESQNVYLTSSIIDLDQFENRKVKVWGETFAAQKAGWLMDVGRLEVLE